MINIQVTNTHVTLENGERIPLEDIIINYADSSARASYLFQQILDYNGKPNWLKIHRKLSNYKKQT